MMMRGLPVGALLLLWAGFLAPSAAVDLVRCGAGGGIAADDLIEWRVCDPEPAWLTTDVARTPYAVFSRHEAQRERAAFLYRDFRVNETVTADEPEWVPVGPRELRLRHRFTDAGLWHWRLHAPRRDGAAAGRLLAEGTVTVAPPRRPHHGGVGINPHNPRLLAFADGTPFIPVGCNIAWAVSPQRLQRMIGYLDDLADHDGTHFRLWCASWSGQIEGDAPDDYRLDHAWLLDRTLAAARDRDLYCTLVLDNHHDLLRGLACPYGDDLATRIDTFFATPPGPQYERRLRYLMARYGADRHILAWELFNEIDEVLGPQAQGKRGDQGTALRWVNAAARMVKRLDHDDHLVTLSLATPVWRRVIAARNLDLVQFHSYIPPPAKVSEQHKDGVGVLAREMIDLNNTRRPYCYSEVGHRGTNDHNPGNDVDRHGILLRHQAWAGLLLGGYGTAMNWWWDVYIDRHDLWGVYTPIAACVQRIDWTDPDLLPVTPNEGSSLRVIGWQSAGQALLWPQVRSDTWHARAVAGHPLPRYRFNGPAITLADLHPDRVFTLIAYDMIDDRIRFERELLSDEHGNAALVLPADCHDLILVVQLEGP